MTGKNFYLKALLSVASSGMFTPDFNGDDCETVALMKWARKVDHAASELCDIAHEFNCLDDDEAKQPP